MLFRSENVAPGDVLLVDSVWSSLVYPLFSPVSALLYAEKVLTFVISKFEELLVFWV